MELHFQRMHRHSEEVAWNEFIERDDDAAMHGLQMMIAWYSGFDMCRNRLLLLRFCGKFKRAGGSLDKFTRRQDMVFAIEQKRWRNKEKGMPAI